MRRFGRYWGLSLMVAPLVVSVAIFRLPQSDPVLPEPLPGVPLRAVETATALPPTSTPSPMATTQASTPAPTTTPVPSTPAPPAPSADSTPTPRPAGTPPRVGIQAGHWKSKELPDELARLRTSSGAFAAGYSEFEVNLDIARRVVAQLEGMGVVVDLLPATVPVDYDADVFVSLHADGSPSASKSGFKLATPWRASRAAQHLLEALTAEYAKATGMRQDDAITVDMRGYYAFNYRRHDHAVARTTPGVILEMGFLTSPADRALMIGKPDLVASAIVNGIMRYLRERDPDDGAALLAPEFKTQRARSPEGVIVRTEPRDDAPVLLHAGADRRFNPLQERDGWYQVFVRSGERRLTGWVRKDQLMETADPTPTPLPSTDS